MECEQSKTEDSGSVLDDVTSHRQHHHHHQQQQQQQQEQQQLTEQLKQICEREIGVTRQLETANKTVENLRQQIAELQTVQQRDAELQQPMNDVTGIHAERSDAVALLDRKALVSDMLYAFLSHSLTSNQQVPLLDSLLAKKIITTSECGEIQKLATVEEKVLMLLSRLRRVSADDTEQWLTTISTVGHKQLTEAKLRTLCK